VLFQLSSNRHTIRIRAEAQDGQQDQVFEFTKRGRSHVVVVVVVESTL